MKPDARARARGWWRRGLLIGALVLGGGAREPTLAPPRLVPDVSQHEVAVNQDFTGTDLLLFGALLGSGDSRTAPDCDIVVVLEGPEAPIVVREKRKVAGVWINADATTFQSAPGFYAVAASRPLARIVDPQTAAIYELGLAALQLSPSGTIDPARESHFSAGLVDLMRREGLYAEDEHGVTLSAGVLYRARFHLPSRVPTGAYTAETFAIRHGRVIASAISRIAVKKQGITRAITDFAQEHSLNYGLFAVSISVLMGWIAGRLFARR